MSIDFDNLIMIDKLGTGAFGTTYLVRFDNVKYALKIQHILEEDAKPNLNSSIWRELDLYNYINGLPLDVRPFFTVLYDYKIYDNCTHEHVRTGTYKGPLLEYLKKIDVSSWCVKQLIEYKGKITLRKYLSNPTNITHKTCLNIIIQLCKICTELYNGGYSHGDFHTGNIMINSVDDKSFMFMGKNIKFDKHIISCIDYGSALHEKFCIKEINNDNLDCKNFGKFKKFLEDKKAFLFNELYFTIIEIITNYNEYIKMCKLPGKQFPWKKDTNIFNKGFKLIIDNNNDFYTNAKKKYTEMFPDTLHIMDMIEKNTDLLKDKTVITRNCFNVLNRIHDEFRIVHPKLHSEYFLWCSYHELLLPREWVLDFLGITNVDDLLSYVIYRWDQNFR